MNTANNLKQQNPQDDWKCRVCTTLELHVEGGEIDSNRPFARVMHIKEV